MGSGQPDPAGGRSRRDPGRRPQYASRSRAGTRTFRPAGTAAGLWHVRGRRPRDGRRGGQTGCRRAPGGGGGGTAGPWRGGVWGGGAARRGAARRTAEDLIALDAALGRRELAWQAGDVAAFVDADV